jgi:outer membrane protein OmpA-like peptidoglycan-associated protein
MKKIMMLTLALLVAFGGAMAQGNKGKGKKKDSPVIEGRQKIRQSDYRSFDRFTQFGTKDTARYYCAFDYSRLGEMATQKKADWGDMQPVINYLQNVSRATMSICFLYAVNPSVLDPATHERLAAQGQKEALEAMAAFEKWKQRQQLRNKVQYKVAEIDYRYFKGAYYNDDASAGDVLHAGVIMYFGSKKKPLISVETDNRVFNDIKFFPNDATVVDSWGTMLDELADYLKENDRKGVLLTGYTDNQGTEAYIMGLSRQRAVEVKKELLKRGIDANRVEVEAKGDADPIGDNATYEGRIQNNRVSVKIQ